MKVSGLAGGCSCVVSAMINDMFCGFCGPGMALSFCLPMDRFMFLLC